MTYGRGRPGITCAIKDSCGAKEAVWGNVCSAKLGRREHTDWAIARDEIGSIVNLAVPHIGGRGSKAVAVHLADPCLSARLLD